MIGLPLGTRVWIGAGVTDMRKGMDGLDPVAESGPELRWRLWQAD